MRRIALIVRTRLRSFAFAILLSAFSLFAAIGLLACSAWLISMASTRPPVLVLEVAIVSVRFFGLSRGVVKYVSRILEHQAALGAQSDLRVRIYQNFTRFSSEQLLEVRSGAFLQQVIGDIESLQDLWLRLAAPLLSALLAGASAVGITFWLLPLAGKVLASTFLLASFIIPFLSALASGSREQRALESEIFDEIVQVTSMVEESIIFGFDKRLVSEIEEMQLSASKIEDRSARRSGYGTGAYVKLLGISVLLEILIAMNGYHHHLLAGVNVAVIILLPLAAFDGLSSLSTPFSRLGQILDAKRSLEPLLADIPAEPTENFIEVPSGSELVINQLIPEIPGIHISAYFGSARPGSPLIIRGKSGAGKSSLIHSLIGFMPYSGTATLGGINLKEIDPSMITTLLQDDHIFTTSIRENIKIGNPFVSDREIMQILEVVELAEFIQHLPEGLDTFVGESGHNLSGGEKQRIKLARALLRNTPLFLLDEPFEYLDHLQADRLTRKVLRVLSAKAVVMVSHTY